MMHGFTPWMIPGLVGVGIAGVAAATARRSRSRAGAPQLLALSVAVGWWCLLQVVLIAVPTLPGKILMAQVQYLGIATAPLAWLAFATAYTSRTLPRAGWALLAAPEAATLALAWTNRRHGLIWERLELVPAGSFDALRIEYGAWFELHVYYAYGLVLVGTLMLVASLAQSPYHWKRAGAVVLASLLPLSGNLLYLLGFTPPRWVDLTPSGFALGGLVLTWSLLRDELLDLPPIARGRILDAFDDGVLVVDSAERVLDMNPSAFRLLGCSVGDTLPGMWGEGVGAAEGWAEEGTGNGRSRRVARHRGRALEISRTPSRDVPGGGAIVTVRDVTERERLQGELEELGRELLRANQELTKLASTDELTGLPNRRRFFQVLGQELRRAARYGHTVALLLLDVDHFKEINDTLGHAAGDQILRGVSGTIERSLRDVDTVGRLGGDELAVVLPQTDSAGAEATAHRILQKVSARAFPTATGGEVAVTVSIGLVVAEPGALDVEALMHDADVALYQAKAAGRNRMRPVRARE